MHLHILGICGTFMAGIALLAREQGHTVSGSDAHAYPPMSTQLREHGIVVQEGYCAAHLQPAPDVVVIGNALSRGNPAVEYVLDTGLRYTSGPQWLAEHVLAQHWVLAVAGTHGKTTTSSMLAWLLEQAGMAPGFLIGGVPQNFGVSARAGDTPFFVVEADEYDTAFFDKRSKFVHYRPRTLVLNNLEFDHADIFPDLAAIKRQFHHLVRTVPGAGLIVAPQDDAAVADVLAMGCWTPQESFALTAAGRWQAQLHKADGSEFDVLVDGTQVGTVTWDLVGEHNVRNALAALAAARHAGVAPQMAVVALSEFRNVRRRLEVRGQIHGVTVYDDFAHHPTAIATTLAGLRAKVGADRIWAVLEPRSNTMRLGVHRDTLAPALAAADRIVLFEPPQLTWPLDDVVARLAPKARACSSVEDIVRLIVAEASAGDHVVVMSNGAFGGIHDKLLSGLRGVNNPADHAGNQV
ncbi:MAG: UDP-N-acetylmuramate:L-alanyl-gamma-D-glutamyl-meso-diaminopimelate ligase [Gammaproteobacteria bacterium SG8_47]|nr:MAG: UDP-N-acetylmuramate:L-alanyl-gamma-D-glutamyl-meso-diaminopimelate ligase [Gammaproteobacteria bacterium SG8_47]